MEYDTFGLAVPLCHLLAGRSRANDLPFLNFCFLIFKMGTTTVLIS